MMRKALLITAMVAVAACSAAARPGTATAEPMHIAAEEAAPVPAQNYQPYVSCDVVARRTSNGVRIEALAHAGDGVFDAVDYDLTVTRHGGGGSSDIVQSGAADLAGGETVTLGVAEFNVERGARYRANLVMSDADGVICTAELRS